MTRNLGIWVLGLFLASTVGCVSAPPNQPVVQTHLPMSIDVSYAGQRFVDSATLEKPRSILDGNGKQWDVIPIVLDSAAEGGAFTALWAPSERMFVQWGRNESWIEAYRPENDFLVPNKPTVFLVALGMTVKQTAINDSGTFPTMNLDWNYTKIAGAIQVTTHVVPFGNVTIRFEYGNSLVPGHYEVVEWELPWTLLSLPRKQNASLPVKVDIAVRNENGGAQAFTFPKPPDERGLPFRQPTRELERYGPAGGGLWGPPEQVAFPPFELHEALRATAEDARPRAFLSAHPDSFVLSAFRLPYHDSTSTGLAWYLDIGEGCGNGADQIALRVRKVLNPVELGAIVDVVEGPFECKLSGHQVTWNQLLKSWTPFSQAVGHAGRLGLELNSDTPIYLTALHSCLEGSPWGLQLALRQDTTELWTSLATGRVLQIRAGPLGTGSGFVQVVECEPSMPSGLR